MKHMTLWDKWVEKCTLPTFDLIAEDDFNPDGVLIMADDLYRDGFRHGVIAASVALSAAVALGAFIIERRNHKHEQQQH